MTKRPIAWLALTALALAGLLYTKGRLPQEQVQAPQPPAVVATVEARRQEWGEMLRAVGSVRAHQSVTVASEVSGVVRAVRFASGGHVGAGEVLVELDDGVDRAELEGLLAEVRLAQLQVERTGKLSKDRLLAQTEADEARAKLEVVQAKVSAKRAMIEKKRIRAPFAGLLGLRRIDPGHYLEAGGEVVSLVSLSPMDVDFSVPERLVARLQAGLPVQVRVVGFPGVVFSGEVASVNPSIEAMTRAIEVRARLPNPGERLRPGMFADVILQLPASRSVVTVPRTAVAVNPYGDAVFVVVGDGAEGLKALRRAVRTGEVREGQVEIVEGLAAGERVVSAGHMKLRNDQPVRVDDSVNLGGPAGDGP